MTPNDMQSITQSTDSGAPVDQFTNKKLWQFDGNRM